MKLSQTTFFFVIKEKKYEKKEKKCEKKKSQVCEN